MPRTGARRADWLSALAVAAAAAWAYAPALSNGFVWDDVPLIVGNPLIRSLDFGHLGAMFVSLRHGLYQPLGWLLYAALYAARGPSPAAFHAAGLTLHGACALLLLAVARRLFAAAGHRRPLLPASAAALLWAVHPIHVGAVAWPTELPGQLATAFFLASVWVYLGPPGRWRLSVSVALFALSGLSKWKGACLPALLVMLDVYPLRRWRAREAWAEKPPYVAVAAAIGFVNALAKAIAYYTLDLRAGALARGLLLLARQLVWPSRMLPSYTVHDGWDSTRLPAGLAVALLVAVTAWLALTRRRWPALSAAWVFLCAAALPALVNGHLGQHYVFLHYAYLAGLGAFVAAAAGFEALAKRFGRAAWAIAIVALAAGWSATSRRYCGYWSDSVRLWTRAVASDERGGVMAHRNLAAALAAAGRPNDAGQWLERARLLERVAKPPELRRLAGGAGGVAAETREPEGFRAREAADLLKVDAPLEALAWSGQALQRRPGDREAHEAMARALEALGRPSEGAAHRFAARAARKAPILIPSAGGR
jgi:hypothetical protein